MPEAFRPDPYALSANPAAASLPLADLPNCSQYHGLSPQAAHALEWLMASFGESDSFVASLTTLIERICQLTQWTSGEVWLPSEDSVPQLQRLVSCRCDGNPESDAIAISAEGASHQELAETVWMLGQPIWVPAGCSTDCPTSGPTSAQLAGGDAQRGSVVGLPVVSSSAVSTAAQSPEMQQTPCVAVLMFGVDGPTVDAAHWVEVLMAIAPHLGLVIQLKQVQHTLWQGQLRLANLLDSMPGIVFIGSNTEDWAMRYLSQGCYSLTGYHSHELIGPDRQQSYTSITHPDDLPQVLAAINEAIAQHRPYVAEYRITTKQGEIKWMWEKGYGIYDETGQIEGLEGFITDITERKRVEDALQASEVQFRTLFQNSAMGIGFTAVDGHFTECNPSFCRMLGYSQAELRSLTVMDVTHPDDMQADQQLMQELLTGQRDFFHLEKRFIHKDRRWVWAHLTVSAIRDANHQAVASFGMVEDITERKQTEDALRQSEARNRDILRAIPDLLFLVDDNGVYLYVQAEQESDLPLPTHDIIGQPIEAVLPEAIASETRQAMAKAYQTKRAQTIEYRLIVAERSQYYEARIAPCSNDTFIVSVRNMTERKENERALQEKEAFLRLILDNIPQYIFWKDTNLVYQGANRLLTNNAGLSDPSQIVGKTDYDLWGATLAARYQESDRFVMDTQQPLLHLLREKALPDGSNVWQDVSKVPIHDTDGNVIGVLGTYEDITERRRAEAALARREEYLGVLVDLQQRLLTVEQWAMVYPQVLAALGQVARASHVYLFENTRDDVGQVFTVCRQAWCAVGMEPQPQPSPFHLLLETTASPVMEAALTRREVYGGKVSDLSTAEQAILQSHGIQAILVLPLSVHDEVYGFIGFDNCIEARTWEQFEIDLLRAAAAAISIALERQRAMEALRHSESRYRLLAEHATDLISRYKPNGEYLYVSPASRSLLGYAPEALIGRFTEELVHPHDLRSVRQAHAAIMAQPEVEFALFTYRIRRSNGQYIWLETRGKAVHMADSTVSEIIAVSRDVTERKRSDDLLAGQRTVLEMIARDCALSETLNALILTIEAQREGMIGSVLLLDADGVHIRLGAAPNLSPAILQSVNELRLGPNGGPCAAAMYYAQPIICSDVSTDPRCNHFRNHVLQSGLRACWSSPILSSQGRVLGCVTLYSPECRTPVEADFQLIDMTTRLAAIAIEQKLAEEALQKAEAKYRGIFENAVEGIFQSTVDGHYLIVNPMLARIYGYDSPNELINSLTNIQNQLYVNPQRRLDFVQLMQNQGSVLGFESEIYRKDGSIIWISECARALYSPEGQLIGYEGTVEDITRRKQDEAELIKRDNLLQGVASATNCLLTIPELDAAIPKALAILGETAEVDRVYIYANHPHHVTREMAMSMKYEWVRAGVAPSLPQTHWQNQPYSAFGLKRWYQAFQTGQSIRSVVQEMPPREQELLSRDGIQSIIMVPIFVEGNLWGFIGFDDCTHARAWTASEESILVVSAASLGGAIKRQQTEEKMRHQAYHDSLTGLPNRVMYNCRLNQTLAQAQRSSDMFAVLFLDLDHFKTINDTLGHAVGDQLLRQATQRMNQCLREEDTIARWGGDEFTLLLPSLKVPEDAAKVAQRIAAALKPVFNLEGHDLRVSCSIGIAIYPYSGKDAQTLLKNADAALYRAKDQGRNNYQFYTAVLNQRASERLTLDSSLHEALEHHEFVLHYQPQFNMTTNEITQMEALIRWQHPILGLVPPSEFIALAEENGLIVPIGEWVLETACWQYQHWLSQGIAPQRIAVNLSARQFQQPDLVEQVMAILQKTGMLPQHLELEITETAAMKDIEFTTQMLRDLRSMGVRIAMDDFGTGYSSLGYLKTFPLHALKIDRSFVQDLKMHSDDMAIITAIVALGHGLNLNVVAEGVETEDQLQLLRSLQCEEMQGYLFSQPLTAQEATQLLEQRDC
ncbi:PAS domain S-box protein [Leptolyngbya sp. AN02str]|uniref:PAS domain S-box protein n=1 Tax=Leptolyngbya sp. AN02str TaxID=3423363 RepID=UPI003D318704